MSLILRPKLTRRGLEKLRDAVATGGKVSFDRIVVGTNGDPCDPLQLEAVRTPRSDALASVSKIGSDTYHVAATIDSQNESFDVKEVGVMSGQTLFAYYYQPTVLVGVSQGVPLLFALDLVFLNLPEDKIAVTLGGQDLGVTFAADLAALGAILAQQTRILQEGLGAFEAWRDRIARIEDRLARLEARG